MIHQSLGVVEGVVEAALKRVKLSGQNIC